MRWIGLLVFSLGLLRGTPVVFSSIIWLRTFLFFKDNEMSLCSLSLPSSFSLSSARKPVSGSSSTMCPLVPQKACTPQVILNTHQWVTSPTTEPTQTTEWVLECINDKLFLFTSVWLVQRLKASAGVKTILVMYKLLQTQWHWMYIIAVLNAVQALWRHIIQWQKNIFNFQLSVWLEFSRISVGTEHLCFYEISF